VELTILVDNAAESQALQAEHGLAILISGPGKKLLFDTAASCDALLQNARSLGVDLADVEASVISHGHSDHTGALAAVVRQRPGLKIYANPSAFLRRWAEKPGRPLKDVSCPHSPTALCRWGAVLHSVKAPERLTDWLVLSGPVGGPKHGKETFVVRKGDEMVVDGFEDELFCLVQGQRGWAVVTGCCHRGLENTLRAAKFLGRGRPIEAIVGGLHLRNADKAELRATVELLKKYGSPELHPCHCTGREATAFLAAQLPGCVHPASAGTKLVF